MGSSLNDEEKPELRNSDKSLGAATGSDNPKALAVVPIEFQQTKD